MADQSDRGKETLIRLEQALQRLLDGNPIKTKPDGRISLKRINDEAGLSSGGIYYYSSFVETAKKTIQLRRQQDRTGKTKVNNERLNKLREQREKEKVLKEKYKEQRDNIKTFCDQVVAHNAQLEFTLFEALEKISYLEQELASYKVSSINGKK
ncbi:hypothetical protein HWA77_09545 [Photobacterium damselae subsp. damselae]|uniref:Orphan protein n=1 Tax=Photobacterium damselae subsp. damselae TaxID=85581 RepID=A0A850QUZ3_PHODD|nr:hypothetical protein [Photobacterium damselae]MCG9705077.1 hypothetical protein [Photobacterium damselae]NVP00450.1 hypothetical protein [Photobacterium damselae subsp. damselae]